MATRPPSFSASSSCVSPAACRASRMIRADSGWGRIGTIGYYERGAGMPKTDNLFALCDILHIRPADLLRADS